MGASKRAESSLWTLKLHYFLHGAGGSPIFPFLPVIVKQMGMSGSAMGFILALNPIVCLFARPLIGSVMDRNPKQKVIIFQVLIVISAVLLYFLCFAPSIETGAKTLTTVCSVEGHRLRIEEAPEPCLLNKLQTLYHSVESDCRFECQGANGPNSSNENFAFKATFIGQESELDEKGFLTILLRKPEAKCIDGSLCHVQCEDENLRRVLNGHKSDQNRPDFTYTNYWIILFCWLSAAVAVGCITSYQDAFCHQILGDDGEALYGQQRLFASIGFGTSALIVGYLVDQASQSSLLYNYTTAFNVMLVAWIIDAFIVRKLSIPQTLKDHTIEENPLKEVSFSLVNAEIVIFLLYCISVGVCYGALTLQFLLLEELGHRSDCNGAQAMKFLQGLCLTLNCIGEIPVFFYSGKLIQRYGSKVTMHVVLLVFAIRFLYYSRIVSPWQILGIEILNGLTTGLFYSSMTSFANQIAPAGSATTTTALAFTVTDGIGIASGSWIGGALYQDFGASFTFACFGLFALIAFFLHIFAHKYLSNKYASLDARPIDKSRH